jgi:hypothetical protein
MRKIRAMTNDLVKLAFPLGILTIVNVMGTAINQYYLNNMTRNQTVSRTENINLQTEKIGPSLASLANRVALSKQQINVIQRL